MNTSETTNLSIRVNTALKRNAEALFSDLGMNLTTAFNVFLRQSLREQGLPFAVTRDVPNAETVKAMQEAERIAHAPDVKGYQDLKSALDALKS